MQQNFLKLDVLRRSFTVHVTATPGKEEQLKGEVKTLKGGDIYRHLITLLFGRANNMILCPRVRFIPLFLSSQQVPWELIVYSSE